MERTEEEGRTLMNVLFTGELCCLSSDILATCSLKSFVYVVFDVLVVGNEGFYVRVGTVNVNIFIPICSACLSIYPSMHS